MVRLNTKDEKMMVHAFRKGIVPRPFSESFIRDRPKTFGEIRRRAVAHITAREKLSRSARVLFPRTHERQHVRNH